MNAMARTSLVGTLLGCLFWLPVSSPAQAVPFQSYMNGACVGTVCEINFAVVPAGRRLEISNVSCYLRLQETARIHSMQLLVVSASGATFPSAPTLVPVFVDALPGPRVVYSANHSIFAFANAGQRFRARTQLVVTTGAFEQFACHISGEMRNLP